MTKGNHRAVKHFVLYGLAWAAIMGVASWLNIHGAALHH